MLPRRLFYARGAGAEGNPRERSCRVSPASDKASYISGVVLSVDGLMRTQSELLKQNNVKRKFLKAWLWGIFCGRFDLIFAVEQIK